MQEISGSIILIITTVLITGIGLTLLYLIIRFLNKRK